MSEELRELSIRVLIICVAVTWLVILWRADRNKAYANFSLLGFVQTKDGFPDRPGAMELGSWVAFTLIMFVLALHDHLTEWYAMIYVGWPAVRAGQVSWLRSGDHAPTMDRVVTDTHEETATPSKPREEAHDNH